MHRRWYTRLGSLLLAAWFVLYATEPLAALHHCPMHDATAGTMSMDAAGGPVAATIMPHGDHQSTPSHHACTCMGDCAGAAFAGLRGAGITFAIAVLPASRVQPPGGPLYIPVTAPHALPFANGPPSFA